MPVYSINSQEQFLNTLKSNQWVIVDFYADWCGPCKRFAPTFETLSSEISNVHFCKVNSDHLDNVCSQFNVTALPTFVLIHNGKEVGRESGANETTVRKLLSHAR
jgi:thioredoxin 1